MNDIGEIALIAFYVVLAFMVSLYVWKEIGALLQQRRWERIGKAAREAAKDATVAPQDNGIATTPRYVVRVIKPAREGSVRPFLIGDDDEGMR